MKLLRVVKEELQYFFLSPFDDFIFFRESIGDIVIGTKDRTDWLCVDLRVNKVIM